MYVADGYASVGQKDRWVHGYMSGNAQIDGSHAEWGACRWMDVRMGKITSVDTALLAPPTLGAACLCVESMREYLGSDYVEGRARTQCEGASIGF